MISDAHDSLGDRLPEDPKSPIVAMRVIERRLLRSALKMDDCSVLFAEALSRGHTTYPLIVQALQRTSERLEQVVEMIDAIAKDMADSEG